MSPARGLSLILRGWQGHTICKMGGRRKGKKESTEMGRSVGKKGNRGQTKGKRERKIRAGKRGGVGGSERRREDPREEVSAGPF